MEKFIRELHRLTICVKAMKVDNIYDLSTPELIKKDIIQDLSRILGLMPSSKKNKPEDIIPDKVFILTDADQLVCL